MLSHYTARSSRCTNPLHPHNHRKKTITPRSAQCPCLACPSRCTEPFRSHNHCKTALSSKSTISLPPLSKVRCCRRKNSGDYRRDCHSTNPPKTAPSLACTITLASLVKGRWIDGKAQTVALLRFACDTSTFLIYQTFCRQDGGIACYKLFQPCRHLR